MNIKELKEVINKLPEEADVYVMGADLTCIIKIKKGIHLENYDPHCWIEDFEVENAEILYNGYE